VFEQERLSYDPSHATRAEEFGEGNEQMDRQDQHIAHERQINMSADQHKTKPGRDSCQKLRIRHPQALMLVAEHGSPTMLARIGVMRALNPVVE
jgi:hypothetical protein